MSNSLNLCLFGKGQVGGALIRQIFDNAAKLEKRRQIKLNIVCIADSTQQLLTTDLSSDWHDVFTSQAKPYQGIDELLDFVKAQQLENLVAVDNTASVEFTEHYARLIAHGFNLVSSNKIANTKSIAEYRYLRETLHQHNKTYLYETNVGAGLPLINTIHLLHASGENITRIRGVFSGSLSYLFNTFLASDLSFSDCVRDAMAKGYTEPDPREDLSGNDVARKLLVLARELDLVNEFTDIAIENLIPERLRAVDKAAFLAELDSLDALYGERKKTLSDATVLRYVADLSGDLQQEKGNLSVSLSEVSAKSPLGQLAGSDTLFEIYTDSYGDKPIVIQGAGAGADVTARGVYGDVLRLANRAF